MAQDVIEGTAQMEDVVTARRADLEAQGADVLMLAYQHIEDARMRLGKIFQAREGGVSNSAR